MNIADVRDCHERENAKNSPAWSNWCECNEQRKVCLDEIERLRGIINLVANCPKVMNAATVEIETILHPYRTIRL
jgi:hypothetical protein